MSKESLVQSVIMNHIRESKGLPDFSPTEQQQLVLHELAALIHDPVFLQSDLSSSVVSRMIHLFEIDLSHLGKAIQAAVESQASTAQPSRRKPFQKW